MNLKLEKNIEADFHSVCLDWNHLQDMLIEMQKKGLKNIAINSAWGWVEGKPLDFLYDHEWIEGIEIIGEDCDITPINNLKNLKYLRITSNRLKGKVDLKNFEHLEYIAIWWQKGKYINLDACTRCWFIYITGFSMENLVIFNKFQQLKELKLNLVKLVSFEGLENCKALKKIDIYGAQQLRSIRLSDEVAQNLSLFSLEKCKRIENYEIMEKMLNLESLYLFEAAPIHSVDFLRKMEKLKYAYIGVDILDGNVSFLKEKGFEFKNARQYK